MAAVQESTVLDCENNIQHNCGTYSVTKWMQGAHRPPPSLDHVLSVENQVSRAASACGHLLCELRSISQRCFPRQVYSWSWLSALETLTT